MLTRRELFKEAGQAGKQLGLVVAVNAASAMFRNCDADHKKERYQQEALQERELKVRHFSREIVQAASRLPVDQPEILTIAAAFYIGNLGGKLALESLSPKTNRVIGGSSLGIGKLVDMYSTYEFATITGDPRFKEYGLDAYFFEINPFLSSSPTTKSTIIMGAIFSVAGSIVGYFIPWLGRGYLAMSPLLAKNNLEQKVLMSYALSLGHHVDKQITNSKSKSEISSYLEKITPKEFFKQ